jgi:hypothetical protein
MLQTPYISTPTSEKVTLAEESWRVLSPFLCRYQWAFDDPSHSPRSVEIASAILNRGKSGACTFFRPEGYKYVLPVLHPRHFEDAITNHRKIYYVSYGSQALLYFDIDLHYAWQTLADGHEAKEKLDALLRKFFGASVLFWSPSSRGFNGYLKVGLKGMDYALANELCERLETALQRFLAYCGNKADFEIKGKIGFMEGGQYQWAQYGKLPVHLPEWSFAKLEEFKATPTVSIHRLEGLCHKIEAQVSQDVLQRHKESKKASGDEPFKNGDRFLVTPAIEKLLLQEHGEAWRCKFSLLWGSGGDTWLHKDYYRPGSAPRTDAQLREAKEKQNERSTICTTTGGNEGRVEDGTPSALEGMVSARYYGHKGRNGQLSGAEGRTSTSDVLQRPCDGVGKTGATNLGNAGPGLRPACPNTRSSASAESVAGRQRPINFDLSDLTNEPDSFERQREAMRRFARYLKRMPTVEEGMQFLHDHHLYTGTWEEHLTRRRARVHNILAFIAETFDPSKCANGSVNVGKYDEWTTKKFPNGLIGGHRRDMDEDGNLVDVCQNIHVSTKFIAVFMAVVEFALLIDKNQDGSVPHDRCKELWNALKDKGLLAVSFNDRKWAVCREELAKLGIIAITDRDYGPGRAMKWGTGTYFPGLGLWKTKKQPSLLGPVDLASFIQEKNEKTTEEHNTFLLTEAGEDGVLGRLSRSRPPP